MDDYVVRLLIKVKGDDEVDAIRNFIDALNKYGLATWTYVAQNARTGELFNVAGTGEKSERVNPEDI